MGGATQCDVAETVADYDKNSEKFGRDTTVYHVSTSRLHRTQHNTGHCHHQTAMRSRCQTACTLSDPAVSLVSGKAAGLHNELTEM